MSLRLRAVIIGAGGQDGFFLKEQLSESGFDVYGYGRKEYKWVKKLDVSSFNAMHNLLRK